MRRHLLCVLLAIAFLAAGCSDDEGGDNTSSTTTTTTAVGATTTSTTAAGSSTTAAPAPKIVLEPEGLGAVKFGQLEPVVVDTLTDAFGAPSGAGGGCELAGTTVTTTRWKELTVQFADGHFDSYTVRPRAGEPAALNLKTAEGIGLGSTKAQLQAAYGNRLIIPGLPPEFQEPNSFAISFPGSERSIRGGLSGAANTATVEGLFTQLCE